MNFVCNIKGLDAMALIESGFSVRRLGAACATGINNSLFHVRGGLISELDRSIDEPTPYTRKQIKYTKATAANLSAQIGFDVAAVTNATGQVTGYRSGIDTPASAYMHWQVHGGRRSMKRLELALQKSGAMPTGHYVVPARAAQLDAYGNVSRSQVNQIISQLGTELETGYNRTLQRVKGGETKKELKAIKNKQRRAYGKAGGQYISIIKQRGKLTPGIYLAQARDFGAKLGLGRTGKLKAIFIFVRNTKYNQRFDFDKITRELTDKHLSENINNAIADHIARLQKPGTQLSLGI